MQLACRRCNGQFATEGAQMAACPACGSIDVAALSSVSPTRSPKAATTERPAAAFSAPVSQPIGRPVPPTALAPYAAAPLAHSPSYPAPPPTAPMQGYAPMQAPQGYAPMQAPPAYPVYPQPINVVIQNHIAAPYAPPYAMAPYTRRKDAGVATLLSFFVPGAGQFYNGQVGKGVAFVLVTVFVNFPLMFVGIGFLTALATWIWAMIDAHSSAEKINRGELSG